MNANEMYIHIYKKYNVFMDEFRWVFCIGGVSFLLTHSLHLYFNRQCFESILVKSMFISIWWSVTNAYCVVAHRSSLKPINHSPFLVLLHTHTHIEFVVQLLFVHSFTLFRHHHLFIGSFDTIRLLLLLFACSFTLMSSWSWLTPQIHNLYYKYKSFIAY